MKRIYLVKKDPALPLGEDDWIMMNAYDFRKFWKTEEGKKRRKDFGKIPMADENDDVITIECGQEIAAELRREADRSRYLREQEMESGYSFFSLEGLMMGDEDSETVDVFVYDDMDTYDMTLKKISEKEAADAVEHLARKERDVILAPLSAAMEKTMEQMAKELGMTPRQFLYWHDKGMKRLREIMSRSRFVDLDLHKPEAGRAAAKGQDRKNRKHGEG